MRTAMNGKLDRKLFIVVLVTLALGLAIPFHQTWGAPAFQTVPTVGPSPTRRATAAPTNTSAPPAPTTAPQNTPAPTRTRRATSLPPTSTDQAVLTVFSDTPEPSQAPTQTALPASDTPPPAAPSVTPTATIQAEQGQPTATETQASQLPAQSGSVTQAVEPDSPAQAGTNWLPAFAVALALLAAGMWLLQRRGAQGSP